MDETDQDKPEEPSDFKLKRAREKGQVARSSEIGFLAGLTAFLAYGWIFGGSHAAAIAAASRHAFVAGGSLTGSPHQILTFGGTILSTLIVPLLILGGSIFALVLAFELAQNGFIFSTHPLKPDFTRLNPAKGLKRIFSTQMLQQTLKNMVKICVFVAISYLIIRYALDTHAAAVTDARRLVDAMVTLALYMLLAVGGAAIVFAMIDRTIVRRQFKKKMRMSRRELKREVRDREGEPRLKQRRRQLHGEFAQMSQSLRNLKSADVLIVNPDHFAIGLRYDRATMAAPRVVARGRNHLAERLKRVAFVYGVTTIRAPELARALYRQAGFEREIPDALFREVAAIYRDLPVGG